MRRFGSFEESSNLQRFDHHGVDVARLGNGIATTWWTVGGCLTTESSTVDLATGFVIVVASVRLLAVM